MAHLRSFWKQILLLGIYAIIHINCGGGVVAIKHFQNYTFQLQYKENKTLGPPKSLHGNPRLWRKQFEYHWFMIYGNFMSSSLEILRTETFLVII